MDCQLSHRARFPLFHFKNEVGILMLLWASSVSIKGFPAPQPRQEEPALPLNKSHQE